NSAPALLLMSWNHIRRPTLGWALLTLGFSLQTLPAWADNDAPANHRHLDWITKEEIAALPKDQRPEHTGMCSGLYLAPPLAADQDGKVRASADRFDTSADGRLLLEGDVMVSQDGSELRSDR